MARPREFDYDQVLDLALNAFWEKGYEATSMSDLEAATGLKRGSLYKAYGDKHELFVKALTRYLDSGYLAVQKTFERHLTLRGAFAELASCYHQVPDGCNPQRGCFFVNSMVELAPHDERVLHILSEHQERVEKAFVQATSEAQGRGEVRADADPESIGKALYVGFLGTAVMAKESDAKEKAESVSRCILDLVVAA